MRDEGAIYVAGHPLRHWIGKTLRVVLFSNTQTKLQILKAQYSLIVLKMPLDSNQSIRSHQNKHILDVKGEGKALELVLLL